MRKQKREMSQYLQQYSWDVQVYLALKIYAAFLLGGIIGWERERVGKEAGIRTFGLICMGSCTFGILSHSMLFADPSRIASQIVVGIGFLGGGLIFHEQQKSKGLTTAASLWVSAAVGIAMAFDYYILAVAVTLLTLVSLHLPSARFWRRLSKKVY